MNQNHLGQPIGFPLPDWTPCLPPSRTPMEGRYCRLDPLDVEKHSAQLWEAYQLDTEGRMWTYLPYGPFESYEEFVEHARTKFLSDDPLFSTVIERASGKAVGIASFMRIEPVVGVIEVGAITFSPALQRTPLSTEAMYLMMKRVFDELGYRRYEWKCDNLNAPSKAAALRLGFQFEGIFRQAIVTKGRNRDTAWFSILDSEWPRLKAGFEQWLDPSNFDSDGRQIRALATFR